MLAVLMVVVGSAGAVSKGQPRKVALGETFDLAVGESASIGAESLQIAFEDVPTDSRCPVGDRCVWQGDATVVVWLQKESAARQRGELHTSPGRDGAAILNGYEVRLLRLAPYPVSGQAILSRDYRATLEVSGRSAAEDR
jgi:hypothetical protein